MCVFKDILEIIYYIAFIVLTGILVWYAKKTYVNEKKTAPILYARINYNLSDISKDVFLPVTVDLLNDGDELMTDIEVEFGSEIDPAQVKLKEKIPFISAHDTYKYYIGTYNHTIGFITWIDGTKSKAFPKDEDLNASPSCNVIVDKEQFSVKVLHM